MGVLRKGILVSLTPFICILVFYLSAFVGAIIPASQNTLTSVSQNTRTALLHRGVIHYDFIIPALPDVRDSLSFLEKSGFDIQDPNILYFSVGWGSKAFYTATGDYKDLQFSTVFRAVTGDQSVMRVFPIYQSLDHQSFDRINMGAQNTSEFLDYIKTSFSRDADGNPKHLQNASLGQNDMFFASPHKFNAFETCNIWIANALTAAGVNVGRWTPTPQSLWLSLWWFKSFTPKIG